MAISSYYGNSSFRTFLDYGEMSQNGLRRVVQRQFFDQDAYDHHHLALYMKDYLNCRLALRRPVIEFKDVPRVDKNLLTYFMLKSFPNISEIVELGSTLFELIDGLEVACKYDSAGDMQLFDANWKSISMKKFVGIEISSLFQELAVELHPKNKILHFTDAESYANQTNDEPRVLVDRSVANYMFETGKEFGAFARNFQYGIINTYFSLEEDFTVTRYGKQMNYLSLSEFLNVFGNEFFHLYGFEAPRPLDGFELSQGRKVVEGFFIMASTEKALQYRDELLSDDLISNFLLSKNFRLKSAHELLNE